MYLYALACLHAPAFVVIQVGNSRNWNHMNKQQQNYPWPMGRCMPTAGCEVGEETFVGMFGEGPKQEDQGRWEVKAQLSGPCLPNHQRHAKRWVRKPECCSILAEVKSQVHCFVRWLKLLDLVYNNQILHLKTACTLLVESVVSQIHLRYASFVHCIFAMRRIWSSKQILPIRWVISPLSRTRKHETASFLVCPSRAM